MAKYSDNDLPLLSKIDSYIFNNQVLNNSPGVGRQSLFYQFPFFNTSKQLPQCSSHDYLEGCVKKWIKIIFESLVKKKWFRLSTCPLVFGSWLLDYVIYLKLRKKRSVCYYFTQNGPRLSFCKLAQLCNQLFLSQL